MSDRVSGGGVRFGVGLFSLASTAFQPRHWAHTHRDLREFAVTLEELGYDELWFSQHHFFYDGQCPSPLTAAASALAVTSRLRVGTGILLLPMFDTHRVAYIARDLNDRSGGRFDLGVGLGFRDVEFDGHGLARRDRLERFLSGLDVLAAEEALGGARVLVGANTPPTVARAGARNHPVLMSGLNTIEVCKALRAAHRLGWQDAGSPGGTWPGVSAYRNIWVTDDENERAAALDWVRASYVQYAGLGLAMTAQSGGTALDFADDADDALQAVVETTLTGPADEVARQLIELADLGFEQIAFRLVLDGAPRAAFEDQLRRLAEEVLPLVRMAVSCASA